MEQLRYFLDEYWWIAAFMVFWAIGALLVFLDIRHQKKHPPKPQNPNYTKYLGS